MKIFLAFTFLIALGGCAAEIDGNPVEQTREAELAVISNNVSATFTLDGLATTIRTGDMPKGWFTPKFDKSPITVAWSAEATACLDLTDGTFGSITTGTFVTIANPGGNLFGYSWLANHDLTGLQNHWRLHVLCDGTTSVVGCAEPRIINYTLSVGGVCLRAGGTCTTNGSVSLPAVRDADLVETDCPVTCESLLGPCVSNCQANCANGDSSCSSCCECYCKNELHRTNEACEPAQPSCFMAKPNAPACLE
jgi:hypothetical protein